MEICLFVKLLAASIGALALGIPGLNLGPIGGFIGVIIGAFGGYGIVLFALSTFLSFVC